MIDTFFNRKIVDALKSNKKEWVTTWDLSLEERYTLDPQTSKILKTLNKYPTIYHCSRDPFYAHTDEIFIPYPNQFQNLDNYHNFLFHEMIHSTGHLKRLGRINTLKPVVKTDKNYCIEEIIAEIGSCLLCDFFNITSTFENSIAYIDWWLFELGRSSNDNIIKYIETAQDAVNYLLTIFR